MEKHRRHLRRTKSHARTYGERSRCRRGRQHARSVQRRGMERRETSEAVSKTLFRHHFKPAQIT